MKRINQTLISLLLVLALAVGLLPTIALAGGDETKIDSVDVFAVYPVAGQHPGKTAVPAADQANYTVSAFRYYREGDLSHPLTAKDAFVSGKSYVVQVTVDAKENYCFDLKETACSINRNSSTKASLISGTKMMLSVVMKAAPDTVTVTLDPAVAGMTPKTLEVPRGARIWDAIRRQEDIALADRPYEQFYDWSESPFETAPGNAFNYYTTVSEPITLYAIWIPCEKSLDVCVKLQENMSEDAAPPEVFCSIRDEVTIDTNWWWSSLDDLGIADLIYSFPFTEMGGMTLYSFADIHIPIGAKLPAVKLHGAKLVSAQRYDKNTLRVVFSIQVPKQNTAITSADVYFNPPRAGQKADTVFPDAASMTPGISLSTSYWFETAEGVEFTEPYHGTFQRGKTYYTMLTLNSASQISWDKLKVNVTGTGVKVIQMVDLATAHSIPNHVGVVLGVTIPKGHCLAVVSSASTWGKVRYNGMMSKWVSVMDLDVDEGTVTLEAKPAPGYVFKMWYDSKTFQTLSKKETYTFELTKDTYIHAIFARKTPFVDVEPNDFFYEPVMWAAVEQVPAITNGTDATHFTPAGPCTREQVVTFLWRANHCPEPTLKQNPFQDVKTSSYAYKAILWAVEAGITKGATDTTFDPKGECTREQIVTFLWRASGCPTPSTGAVNPFKDVKTSAFSYKAILWAVEEGVTKGTTKTTFGPKEICNRSQVVTFLYRVYGPKG